MLDIRVDKEIVARYIEPHIDHIQQGLLNFFYETEDEFKQQIQLGGDLGSFKCVFKGREFVNTKNWTSTKRLIITILFHEHVFMTMDYHDLGFASISSRSELLQFISVNISYLIHLFVYDVNRMLNLGYVLEMDAVPIFNGVRFARRLNNSVESFVYTDMRIDAFGARVERVAGFILPNHTTSVKHGYGMTSHFNAVKSFLTGDWGMNSYFDKIEMMDIVPRDMWDVLIKEE